MIRRRVLLADPHQILMEGLQAILEPTCEVIGTVTDGMALIEAAQRLEPDLVVTELLLPLRNGIEAIRQLTKSALAIKVLVLTMHDDVAYVVQAFEAGAAGYVLKHSSAAELLYAIDEAMHGRIHVTPRLTHVIEHLLSMRSHPSPASLLTYRQREVLQLLAEGHSVKEIAALLHISPRTAEFHKYRIMNVLGMRSSAALIHYAIRQGITAL
jgi:DNA-binding NarL/FixJ family response regulator